MNARSASLTVTTTAPLAVVSTAAHDRGWCDEEATRTGADWSGVVAAALEMMVAAGFVEQAEPGTMTTFGAPSWREAAIQYHRERSSCLVVEIEPKRLERLRRLIVPDISLEHAWHELRDNRPTPAVTVEALKVAVRERDDAPSKRRTNLVFIAAGGADRG